MKKNLEPDFEILGLAPRIETETIGIEAGVVTVTQTFGKHH
jgi:hypothetical protein